MITYPYTLTWQQLAELPEAATYFDWDPSQADPECDADLAARIEHYSGYLQQDLTEPDYCKLPNYITALGFVVTPTGVTVHTHAALELTNSLLGYVMLEYDEPPYPGGPDYVWPSRSPTWELFNISGDDSVDYFGTQPSCLTALLLSYHNSGD